MARIGSIFTGSILVVFTGPRSSGARGAEVWFCFVLSRLESLRGVKGTPLMTLVVLLASGELVGVGLEAGAGAGALVGADAGADAGVGAAALAGAGVGA